MDSVQRVQSWPVENAASAVVGAGGVRGAAGDGGRVFALASVTKLLSAYGVLLAVEEGAVELDHPAGPPGSTVRHLLAHASGLAFGEGKVMADPGAKRIYSNAGFEVLGESVGAQTGIAFADYLREGVFEPLGMSHTALTGSAGHDAESTVDDLARFAAELLTPTLLAPRPWMRRPPCSSPALTGCCRATAAAAQRLGAGLRDSRRQVAALDGRAQLAARHSGTSGSPARSCGWTPRAGRGVALTDRDFGAWAKPLWREFSDSVVAEVAEVRRIGSA